MISTKSTWNEANVEEARVEELPEEVVDVEEARGVDLSEETAELEGVEEKEDGVKLVWTVGGEVAVDD